MLSNFSEKYIKSGIHSVFAMLCAPKAFSGYIAIALRVGMAYEGTLREEEWLYDNFVDHAVYSMLHREFNGSLEEQEINDC